MLFLLQQLRKIFMNFYLDSFSRSPTSRFYRKRIKLLKICKTKLSQCYRIRAVKALLSHTPETETETHINLIHQPSSVQITPPKAQRLKKYKILLPVVGLV